jgi:hypothetical protein
VSQEPDAALAVDVVQMEHLLEDVSSGAPLLGIEDLQLRAGSTGKPRI